ncbi:MAG: NUDIX domain-containing protein [Candidatus Pacebacteria bacterium]|nr:NUDIX domain-containing protein [Candidatus Paceibacterota bacterium]
MISTPNPRVGIAVFIFREGKFLMLKRKGSHGSGTWSVPGGHLEFGESFEDTVRRETLEETVLSVRNIRFGAVTNDHFEAEQKHYVTVWMVSDYESGEASIMEPEKCDELGWFDFDTLPSPLFLPWNQLLNSEFLEGIKKQVNLD